MQEVSRRTAREIFGSTVNVYLRPEFVRHMCLGDTKKDFSNWFEMYKRQTASSERGSIKIVERLGVSEKFNDVSSSEYILASLAESCLHAGHETNLESDIREFVVGLYDVWKSKQGEFLKSLRGVYPTGEDVVNNLDIETELPPQIIKIPSGKHLLGVGSILEKKDSQAGCNRHYEVEAVEPSNANLMNKGMFDVKYAIQRGAKAGGRFYPDETSPKMIAASSMDTLDNYFVSFKVPLSPKTLKLPQRRNVPA
jgi:hypothetical protein